MGKTSHSSKPLAADETSQPVPLPDRTRVEPSPFAEDDPNATEKRKVKPEDETDPHFKGRKSTAQPSIIVDHALDVEPPAPNPKRQSMMRAKARSNGHASSDEEWGPPESASEANATRIAPPPERKSVRLPKADEDDENATSAGPPVSVEVISGPDRGVRVPVRGGRMIVGRGDGCDLKLTDASVSRRHLELTAGPGGVVLRDLGSGNGTRVNGKREVEIVLNHTDQVALGETVFAIIDELKRRDEESAARAAASAPRRSGSRRMSAPNVPAARQRTVEEQEPGEEDAEAGRGTEDQLEAMGSTGVLEAPPARHLPPARGPSPMQRFLALPKPMKIAVVGAAMLVLLVLVLALASGSAPKPVDENAKIIQKETLYQKVKGEAGTLLRAGKYEQALAKYEEAREIFDKADLQTGIDSAKKNLETRRVLNDAKVAASRADYDMAIDKVKSISEDSDAFDEAKELTKKWGEQRDKALAEQVRKAAQEGDLDKARSLMDKVPEEYREGLKKEVNEIEKQNKLDKISGARNAAAAAAAARAAKARKQRAEVDEAIAPVVHKMETGDFDGAVRQCDRVAESNNSPLVAKELKVLKRDLPGFGQAYTDGMSRFNGGAYEQAAGSLLKALKLFETMDVDSQKIEGQLKTRTAQCLAYKGRSAAARQDYGTAARAYKEAQKINPGSAEARDGLAAIRRNAEEVYQEGYAIMGRDQDMARKRFQDVVDMVPAGDPLADKARKRLEELGR